MPRRTYTPADIEWWQARAEHLEERLAAVEELDADDLGHGLFCASHYDSRPCDCWAKALDVALGRREGDRPALPPPNRLLEVTLDGSPPVSLNGEADRPAETSHEFVDGKGVKWLSAPGGCGHIFVASDGFRSGCGLPADHPIHAGEGDR